MKRTPPDIDGVTLKFRTKPNYTGFWARLVGAFVWCVGWTAWAKAFNTKYHTTIDGVLYSPPGRVPSEGLIVHEKLHVVQERTHCCFKARYILSSAFRLQMEAEAYALQHVRGHITRSQALLFISGKTYWPLGAPHGGAILNALDSAIRDYRG